MPVIDLENVSKSYWPGPVQALSGVTLDVREGEILTLLGPSGCGKTTTLRLIAGFEAPDEGTIRVRDTAVSGNGDWVPPEHRGVGMVFQDYALFPHLSVGENVMFGLHGRPKSERPGRAREVLELLDLSHHFDRYPHELSGGQQQRLCIARAIALQPEVLLMDEPCSALDPRASAQIEELTRELAQHFTVVIVTHNLQQANQVDAEVRYWKELPGRREILMALRGGYFVGEDFNALLFKDSGVSMTHPDFGPDRWEGAGKLEVQTPFGERSSLYARSELEIRTYEETEIPDRGEFSILFGARSRYFRNVEIDVAGGYGMVAFKSNDDLHRFVGEGSLRVRLPNGWALRASAANRFVSDLSGNVFVETTGRMGIEKHFGEMISASIAAFISRLENDAWAIPKNLFGGAEFRIQSRIGRHTVVAITYRYWENAGDFSIDDFNQDRVALEFFYRR
ncbi:MAG: ABC transporter ATP-binding protein [Myxococcales bacterium]|nr:ABC transporter ATP-binding protein [Myxococcales bacterium]